MSHTYDESAVPASYPDVLEVADDGDVDAMTAPGSPSSIVTDEEMLGTLADRTRWLWSVVQGSLFGRLQVDGATSTHQVNTRVGPLVSGLRVLQAPAGYSYTVPVPGGAGWQYLYAVDNGSGGFDLAVSATGPDGALLFLAGETPPRSRYLCPLRWYSDSGIKLAGFRFLNGVWRYQHDAAALEASLSLAITSTGALSLVVSSVAQVPPTARIVHGRLLVDGGASGGALEVGVDAAGFTGQPSLYVKRTLGVNERWSVPGALQLVNPSSPAVEVAVFSAGGTAAASFVVDGWEE